MASMEPTEGEISQVIDFAGLNRLDDRGMVIQALKNNSRNVEAVVMSYFDNPDGFRQKFTLVWNDNMFGADRNGENENNAGSSFHVEQPNPNPNPSFFIESMNSSVHESDVIQGVTPPPDRYGPGAPSRPPSRSNAKSPLGRMVDMTASDVPRFVGQSDPDQLNQDMERALRESAQEAGIAAAGQESGVLENTSTPYFGPATRTQYDHADWAMVPVGGSNLTSNVLPAADRQRKADAPAFLVQHPNTVGNHRLGGLLTILHEIPLARNILLRCGTPSAGYGYDNEWWKGKGITPPQSAHAPTPGSDLEWGSDDDVKPGFEDEIHRLMAFLDSTERSYGSTSVLTELVPYPAIGPEKQFYESLGQRNGEKVYPLTHVASLAPVHGDDLGEDEDARFGLLEIEHLKREYNTIKTLYEALDHLMWSDVLSWSDVMSWNELSEESKMAMFKEMGEVIAIKFGGEGPEDSLDIPTELYPEKYLTSRKRDAHRIQKAWCETKLAMMRIAREEQAAHEWRDDFNQLSFNKKVRMEKAAEQWRVLEKYLQSAGQFTGMKQSGFDTNRFPDYHEAPEALSDMQQETLDKVGDVLKLTERVLSDVDKKLEGFNSELARLKAKLRSLGRLLTDPDKDRPQPMICKRYLLRGVATERDIIYVCRRQQTDLIDLGDTPKKPDQWWRLAYVQGEEHPVKAEKIEIERCLREVWQETKTPLLIYATEDALNTPNDPLSLPLERFVKADNKAFRNELNMESSNEQENRVSASFMDPISPSKRKHRADSIDSLDSNHASLGSDDGNGFDNPFEEQPANFSFQRGEYQPHVMDTDGLPVPTGIGSHYNDYAGISQADLVGQDPDMKPPDYSDVQPPAREMEQLLPQRPSFPGAAPQSTERAPTESVMDIEMPSLEKET
ncbi:hypothetical protein PWT90_00584 [Aphanocladium album]|nr:hypothetical protein PWT90_00584 [Aphanocladium album]